MENFEHRRDRFNTFCAYENPALNISLPLVVPDFRPYCKSRQLPPFHFFLYCLLMSVREIDNFMYRIYEGEVIKIDDFYASFTAINQDNNYNYASFTRSDDLEEFIERSVKAGQVARTTRELINTGADMTARERKNNIFTTCMPWIDMSAIAHPAYRLNEPDIPMIAWGRCSEPAGANMTVPFSVQAHHGFVDGYHIHLLCQALAARIGSIIN